MGVLIVIELHRNKSDVEVWYIVIELHRNKSDVEVWSIVIEQSTLNIASQKNMCSLIILAITLTVLRFTHLMESSNMPMLMFLRASLVWSMVLNATFNNFWSYIMAVSFIGGGNRSAPWYSWAIAKFALNNNHSLTHS